MTIPLVGLRHSFIVDASNLHFIIKVGVKNYGANHLVYIFYVLWTFGLG